LTGTTSDGPGQFPCKIDTPDNHPLFLGNHRDDDRLRLIRYAIDSPEGVPLSKVVRDVFGKTGPVRPGDPDYQFARRFYTENPKYFDTKKQNGMTAVEPRLPLIDLITEGITQKRDVEPGRQFCRSLLEGVDTLDGRGKSLLGDSLERYVDRINDYVMLFELEHMRSGRTERFTKPYKTRFNDLGRISKHWARYNDALEHAYDEFDNAVLCTLTTDPKRFDSLMAMIESINDNFNSLMSWLAYEPATNTERRPGYRPEYLCTLEFTADGKPHLHVLFFDLPTNTTKQPDPENADHGAMPWLCNKSALSHRWSELGQGRIVDVQPLVYQDDLGDAFQADTGFVAWNGEIPNKNRQEFAAQQTAGQYLGKYLSAMFGGVADLATDGAFHVEGAYEDKAATYKLALYWATNRRMWRISRNIEEAIDPEETEVELPVQIRFIGTYRYWDLPSKTVAETRELASVEDLRYFEESPDVFEGLDPPSVPV
jgi:hypothetical protein